MTLQQRLDELLELARKADRAETFAAQNPPYAVDVAGPKGKFEAAKGAFLQVTLPHEALPAPGPDENVGFHAMFVHPDGEHYWVLLKGDTDLVDAARCCEAEARRHGVRFARLEPWKRGEKTDGVRVYVTLIDGLLALRAIGGSLSSSTEAEVASVRARFWESLSPEEQAVLDGPDGLIEQAKAYWTHVRGSRDDEVADPTQVATEEDET